MKTVSLVGKARGWEKVLETAGEIWTVSTAYHLLKDRADKVFELHDEMMKEPWLKSISHKLVGMNSCNLNCETLPRDTLIRIFGKVFAGSIPWMIGYAVFLGFEKINIFGVHMLGKEYGKQRDSTFYMMGRAARIGVDVYVPPDSGLYLNKLYGVKE